ncbi:hypothetical protein [Butyrivibrio sp. NC3005]|uniref:hypothetical protein n=1 Tax=Butyrivibrio sp. NC3005 TaxID=1280685 RepID=UPI0003FD1F56|nr:hypothetical protein [Butyrivibrio sp. NC3005]
MDITKFGQKQKCFLALKIGERASLYFKEDIIVAVVGFISVSNRIDRISVAISQAKADIEVYMVKSSNSEVFGVALDKMSKNFIS